MELVDLARVASQNNDIRAEVECYCRINNLTAQKVYNQLSLHVATHYQQGRYSFEFCDAVVNLLFDHMLDDFGSDARQKCLPEPAFAIYLAFDSGEYHHSEDEEHICPIIKYTNPEIARILEKHRGRD
ncbi:hypothetical protein VISI1226_08964 [Vibrio sinaloensis DSM 21326]|uniref:Uncharacterized protein n=1 Tax=Vibrio sinaloensis DSM 21326 TaxID=945550 RepID=E8MC93_PHOS4|nr:hypothetical protein [Vibrio sinaloensis]EGA68398.1 hypothetical protein VISI1226_08964 [Vibrio sinaloensis DSM 21326]